MNLKLLLFCLFLAVLLIPAELRPKKEKKHHRLSWRHKYGKPEKKIERFRDIIKDTVFRILDEAGDDDDDDDDDENSNDEWLIDIQRLAGVCNPNPCLNNGVCEQKGKRQFKCDCPSPYKGRKCQKGPNPCKAGRCGRGECVLTSTAPFFECKCKLPFQPPHCRHFALCEPNPCMNGGSCIRDGADFDCLCPSGYSGRFCHVGPDDCFESDGESYRGKVSETEDGHECLYWNSHFILEGGVNPFKSYEDDAGLGPHNFCRNPDGDTMPWCFYRKGRKLHWQFCDVEECPEPTGEAPTEVVPPSPTAPTTTTTTKAAPTQPPSQAPQTTRVPTQAPLLPNTTTSLEFSTCGLPQPKKVFTRIFGGLKVPPGSQPWQVSLQVRPTGTLQPFRHTCGGVLIGSCWVLTAGHCIERRKDMQVVMGTLILSEDEPTKQTLEVEEVIRHENYKETQDAVYNDIALLKLKATDGVCAHESQFVKTACLPEAELPDGIECTISGWGATVENELGSDHLLDANVLLINQEKCSESTIYGGVLDYGMLCAGHLEGGVDSCQGDSGGPLTCKQSEAHVIYGLVSWGDQCGRKNKPGVYSRVTHFLDWIKSKTKAASS
ncbi:hypothetical protein PAMA_002669 [Pampus argenteus]